MLSEYEQRARDLRKEEIIMKRIATITATVGSLGLALVLLAACAPATPAAHVDTPTTSAPQVSDTPSDTPVADPSPTAGAFKVGQSADLGDWTVTVTKVTKVSTKTAKKWNPFNDAAKGVYVLVDFTAKYTGTERDQDLMFLTWTYAGTDKVNYDSASVVTPADEASWPTSVRPGGSAKGQEIFDVPVAAVTGGAVSVTTMLGDSYADFTV